MEEPQMPRRTMPVAATLAAMAPFFLSGCDSDSSIAALEGNSLVSLTLQGLQPLDQGQNYQAWLVAQTDNNLIGIPVVMFNADEQGRMVHHLNPDSLLSGPFQSNVAASAVLGVAVSIELSTQLVAYSSSTFILSGEASGGTAVLKADDWLALNRDFSSVGGGYVLATPTDEDPENELSGIWFIDPSGTPVAAGLQLPEAPEGWIYEGWVEVDGKTLSTGKFVVPGLPDSAATYSGPGNAHPFPGEDFIANPPAGTIFPLDLTGASVYITVEPWEDFDVAPDTPFFLRVLQGEVPAGAESGIQYGLTSVVGEFPTGTATVQDGS
jgi:hypothetical protein